MRWPRTRDRQVRSPRRWKTQVARRRGTIARPHRREPGIAFLEKHRTTIGRIDAPIRGRERAWSASSAARRRFRRKEHRRHRSTASGRRPSCRDHMWQHVGRLQPRQTAVRIANQVRHRGIDRQQRSECYGHRLQSVESRPSIRFATASRPLQSEGARLRLEGSRRGQAIPWTIGATRPRTSAPNARGLANRPWSSGLGPSGSDRCVDF